jgi:hypothetical protein
MCFQNGSGGNDGFFLTDLVKVNVQPKSKGNFIGTKCIEIEK